jgi:hypothetical protein
MAKNVLSMSDDFILPGTKMNNPQNPIGTAPPPQNDQEKKKEPIVQAPPPPHNLQNGECRYGDKCILYGCRLNHPIGRIPECKYGERCNRISCSFLHPKNSLARHQYPQQSYSSGYVNYPNMRGRQPQPTWASSGPMNHGTRLPQQYYAHNTQYHPQTYGSQFCKHGYECKGLNQGCQFIHPIMPMMIIPSEETRQKIKQKMTAYWDAHPDYKPIKMVERNEQSKKTTQSPQSPQSPQNPQASQDPTSNKGIEPIDDSDANICHYCYGIYEHQTLDDCPCNWNVHPTNDGHIVHVTCQICKGYEWAPMVLKYPGNMNCQIDAQGYPNVIRLNRNCEPIECVHPYAMCPYYNVFMIQRNNITNRSKPISTNNNIDSGDSSDSDQEIDETNSSNCNDQTPTPQLDYKDPNNKDQ